GNACSIETGNASSIETDIKTENAYSIRADGFRWRRSRTRRDLPSGVPQMPSDSNAETCSNSQSAQYQIGEDHYQNSCAGGYYQSRAGLRERHALPARGFLLLSDSGERINLRLRYL